MQYLVAEYKTSTDFMEGMNLMTMIAMNKWRRICAIAFRSALFNDCYE